MDRLADWEVATLVRRGRGEAGGLPSRRAEATAPGRDDRADFEELLTYVWRRHLAAAVARVESLAAADDEHVETTVGFADLVALQRADQRPRRGRDRRPGRESSRAAAPTWSRGTAAASSRRSATRCCSWRRRRTRAFDIAVGHRRGDRRRRAAAGRPGRRRRPGPVVMRMGDVYGPAVNLAARLTAVARRNRVITDAQTADRLAERPVRDPDAAGAAGARLRRPGAGRGQASRQSVGSAGA